MIGQGREIIGGPLSRDRTGREFIDGLLSRDRTGREFIDGLLSRDRTGREFHRRLLSRDRTGREFIGGLLSRDRTGMRAQRRIPLTPLEVLQLMPPPLEVLQWNHDRVRVCCWATTLQGLRQAPPLGEVLRQVPSPGAVPWWCMWPKCNIVQSPPWEAFRTG